MDCWRDNLLCDPLRSSSGSLSAGAATSAMAEMATTRSTEIANRIGQLETNSLSDHVAGSDAEQHDGPAADVDHDTEMWGKSGKPDVLSYGARNDWEPVMLWCSDQLDKKPTNDVKNAESETLVMNVGLISGPEKDSDSALLFLNVLRGNSRDGEGLEDWRRYLLELDL